MKIYLTLAFIFLSFASYSQYSFGLKAGGSYCNLIANSEAKEYLSTEYGYKLSYQAGILGRVALNNRTRVDMELLYADKGFGDVHLTYINLPVLFQYNVWRRLSIGAGMEVGFLLSSYYKLNNSRITGRLLYSNLLDLSALIGLEYQLTDNLGLSLRYVKGMANILAAENYYYLTSGPVYLDFSEGKVTNSSFQASVSYWLRRSDEKLSDKPAFNIASDEKGVRLSAGFKAGYSDYTLFGDEARLRKGRGAQLINRKALELGFVIKAEIYKYLYAKVELDYLQKGGHLKGGGWTHQSPVEVNYLSLPFLIGLSPIKTEPVTLSFEAGFAHNTLVSSDIGYSKDIVAGYSLKENTGIGSKLFGIELATDIINKLTLFANYRYSKDRNFFHARVNSATEENYDLWNKGNSICFGVRFKGEKKDKPY